MCAFTMAYCLGLTSPALAQRELKDIPDPDPRIELESFQVAEGFEVNLFAADPAIAKPIQMNFDSQGRLWIASSEVYPQIAPGQEPVDRILVVEDIDGDGRADKTDVFTDGLLIPTGVEPGDGGVYVANSTELLHFRDTDGDGRADQRRVMLSGFGTEDTHHILHTLRWGYDGLLYFNQSIYIHSHIETPWGVRRLNGGGIWQYQPESGKLEVLMKGLCNPWGHHFDRFGQSFATDGAGGEGVNYVMPGAVYFTSPGAVRTLHGLNPGSPKHCGIELVDGRHLPDDWQGNVITNDFRAHRVCRFVLGEEGAGYSSTQQTELIKTENVAFRPIDVKLGPDGAIYIADWYNPIIQHGEVDFRDPRRDHTHGRIWRVTAKGRPTVERPKLVGATIPELLDHLKSPESWTRHHAKRVLRERGREVLPYLAYWVDGLDKADAQYDNQRLEALWVYQAFDTVQPELLAALLESSQPQIRAAATRVVAHWGTRLPNTPDLLAARAADEHPRVRLETLRCLGQIPTSRSVELAASILSRPMDRFLDYGLWLTARELEPVWLSEVLAGRRPIADANPLAFFLLASDDRRVVEPLVAMIRAGEVPQSREEEVLKRVAAHGDAAALGVVLDRVLPVDLPLGDARQRVLDDVVKATPQRGVRPGGDLNRVGELLQSNSESLASAAARAIGTWQLKELAPKLGEIVRAKETGLTLRRAAIDGLLPLGDPGTVELLKGLTSNDYKARVRGMAIVGLAAVDLPAAVEAAVALLVADAEDSERFDVEGLFNAMLERQEGPALLAAALSGKSIKADRAQTGLRLARTRKADPALIAALESAGGVTAEPRTLTERELNELVSDAVQRGDAARGESIYRRAQLNCIKCHAIGGAGGVVGPDLVSIGASAPVDYLVESLILPGKAVKENYHSVVVSTSDGRLLTGIKVRETADELVLRTADDEIITLATADVDEQAPGGSLMPVGLVDPLSRDELVDLVRFLSELGKVGPYSIGQAKLVRRWEKLEASEESSRFLSEHGCSAVANGGMSSLAWTSAYSQVSGDLPLAELTPVDQGEGKPAVSLLRFDFDVSTEGAVRLHLNSPAGVTMWLDGVEHTPEAEMTLELAAGAHQVLVAVDRQQRNDALRIELIDLESSPARAQPRVGK
ncbi:MAG: HEAT repeat domain-containing protein [Pirellulales bacterium]|nr:HEAT repeat domain-containing protein [Pirellulales bacterium]